MLLFKVESLLPMLHVLDPLASRPILPVVVLFVVSDDVLRVGVLDKTVHYAVLALQMRVMGRATHTALGELCQVFGRVLIFLRLS
jgi:hypothetical protein